MAERKHYKTKQRDVILSCLAENKGQHVTVAMIMDYLKEKGESVGQTTVYRNLELLVNEGVVFKYSAPEGMGACYQYAEQSEDCLKHYHLTCIQCEKLMHIECKMFDELTKHLSKEHKFRIDNFKTVLYGYCDNCIEVK